MNMFVVDRDPLQQRRDRDVANKIEGDIAIRISEVSNRASLILMQDLILPMRKTRTWV